MKRWCLYMLLAAAVAGCATEQGQGDNRPWPATVTPARSENDRLLDYYSRLTQLKAQDLGREYEKIRKGYEQQPSDFRRIQLAMLLSLPGATFRDDAAALALLQSWTKDKRGETSALKPMAELLQSYLQGPQRTDEAMQAQAGNLYYERHQSENDRLLDYYARLMQMNAEDLGREYEFVRKEYESVRKGYEQPQSDFRRIQLAMLLSMPNAAFRDDVTAIAMLQSWTKDKRSETSALKPMAELLQSYLQDLQRIGEEMQTQAGKLRDEQRRTEALQQKLEALLEMEMKMIEREQAAQPKKR